MTSGRSGRRSSAALPEPSPTDPQTWTPELGAGGWGCRQLQRYTASASNAAMDGDGRLAIVARRELGNSGALTDGECVGSHPTAVHGTVHGPGFAGLKDGIGHGHDAGVDLSQDFHVYGVEWGEDSVVTESSRQRVARAWGGVQPKA
jgi:Glycosyl hydrolases family 16